MARQRKAWAGSRYQETRPAGWHRIRMAVMRRDKFRCQHREPRADGELMQCPNRATDVDHIDDPESNAMDNLRALCGLHHQEKSSRAGGRAAALAREQRLAALRRPKKPHPSQNIRKGLESL